MESSKKHLMKAKLGASKKPLPCVGVHYVTFNISSTFNSLNECPQALLLADSPPFTFLQNQLCNLLFGFYTKNSSHFH